MHQKTAHGDVDDYMTCPACDKIFASFKPYKGPQANDEDGMEGETVDGDSVSGSSNKGKKRKDRYSGGSGSKGVDALGYEPKVDHSTWVDKSDGNDLPLVPSAKTVALKAILLKGFTDAPTDKVSPLSIGHSFQRSKIRQLRPRLLVVFLSLSIRSFPTAQSSLASQLTSSPMQVVIYAQFHLLCKIVGRICDSEKWGFLYLTGDCSLEHRSEVVKKFRDDPNVKILISGLKCGGLGLNFPWANRCISLDLWVSPSFLFSHV
jgi:SNF2 family DNA or RNA helicase